MSVSAPVSVSRDQQRQQTRQRIYECALDLFRRDGVAACRLEDVAKAAGVSRGAFYFHFPTKEHVLLERMRETEAQICDAIHALPEATPIEQVLATLNDELARIWEHDPQLLPDVCSAALRFTATAMQDPEANPMRATLAARFAGAAARGELAGRLPPQLSSDLFLGNMLAGLLAWYASPAMPLRIVLAAVSELFWNGARMPTQALAEAANGSPPRAVPTPARRETKKTMTNRERRR